MRRPWLRIALRRDRSLPDLPSALPSSDPLSIQPEGRIHVIPLILSAALGNSFNSTRGAAEEPTDVTECSDFAHAMALFPLMLDGGQRTQRSDPELTG
jgi:hypothetical protein